MSLIINSWNQFIDSESKKEYFKNLQEFINQEYKNKTCFPIKEDIYNAFKLTPLNEVKVVILGQDPYHGDNQAHGLSFSVKHGVKHPPSLRNIYKELETDLNITRETPDLTQWAQQGVLLLNTTLTVEKANPMSHANKGWEDFTDNAIKLLNQKDNIIFILWGGHARKKKKLITNKTITIIEGPHPSPLSSYRGFFGSRPFSKINKILKDKNLKEIDWR